MNNIFEHSSSEWVKFSEYIFAEDDNGELYIMPSPSAEVKLFNPLENAEQMVVDALNVGWTCMNANVADDAKRQTVFDFIHNYGLLGFITALPTTPRFMDFNSVYLMKNKFIKEETMTTDDYLKVFFPFKHPPIIRTPNGGYNWTITGNKDMMAVAMTMADRPMALNMAFQYEYAERYDWLLRQFKDWAFMFFTTVLYYDEDLDKETKPIYQEAMSCFDGIAPTYHIELRGTPTIVWDFHSLSLAIQMMFSFMLTNGENPLKICRHCSKVFKASRPKAIFCSPQCKNRYNVYKSRAKKKENNK